MNLSVGIKVDGFQERKITDDDLQVCKASKIVVFLDKEANDRLIDYYMTVRKILRQGDNKLLILINEDDNPNVAQAITHLCLEYGCYNIYKVVNESVIDKEYVMDMFKRESSQSEVQMYIGSEDEAYETITEALLHITECCIENKLDDLQDYIIQNKDLIQRYPFVIDYMKQNIDEVNQGIGRRVQALEKELKRVQDDKSEVEHEKTLLQKSISDLETVIKQREEDNLKYMNKISSYDETLKKLQQEKESLEAKANQLQSTAQAVTGGGAPMFSNYTPMKLTQIRGNKLKTVIYFKEVTRPKYINTMVTELFKYLNAKNPVTRGKTKLVIFDSKEDFGILYNPLVQANTNTYFENRLSIMSSDMIVFTDTNPTYLDELAVKSKAEYLIIYDRLGKNADLLTGEAVVKFYTFGSKKDLINYKSKFTDLDESKVIMNPCGINNILELQQLDDFNGNLYPTAKFTKYFKMSAGSGKAITLWSAILSKCGLPMK